MSADYITLESGETAKVGDILKARHFGWADNQYHVMYQIPAGVDKGRWVIETDQRNNGGPGWFTVDCNGKVDRGDPWNPHRKPRDLGEDVVALWTDPIGTPTVQEAALELYLAGEDYSKQYPARRRLKAALLQDGVPSQLFDKDRI